MTMAQINSQIAAHRLNMKSSTAEEGGYTVTCPALPGLVTEGDT